MIETLNASFIEFLGNKNSFAKLKFENGTNLDTVKASGRFDADLKPGEWVAISGTWRKASANPARSKYSSDPVFKISSIRPTLPQTRKGVYQMLSSIFSLAEHGINGQRINAFVTQHLGAGATMALSKPDILLSLTADPKRYGAQIQKTWKIATSPFRALRILQSANIGEESLNAIMSRYRGHAQTIIEQDPYLFSYIPGVEFDEIDNLGKQLGIPANDPRRVAAVLMHLTATADAAGHTFVSYADLKNGLSRLGVTGAALTPILKAAPKGLTLRKGVDGNLILQKSRFYQSERGIAIKIAELLHRDVKSDRANIDIISKSVLSQDKYQNLRNDPSQVNAVRNSVRSHIAVLKGGPGTGKSTVTEAIAEIASIIATGPVLLAAPSGKAARRQEEATQYKYSAQTVHKLLKADPATSRFTLNETNPLPDGAFVIIDEASMLDVEMAHGLLKALPRNGRILFVGDEAQLQSVGAGNFFSDIINTAGADGQCVPVSKLDKVHRNTSQSMIAHYAKQIREGTFQVSSLSEEMNARNPDVAFRSAPDADILRQVVRVITEDAIGKHNLNPLKDVIVLCPVKDGPAGTWKFNRELSAIINPNGAPIPGLTRSGQNWGEPTPRLGDRVMMTENDEHRGVSNGDVGVIKSYHPNKADPKSSTVLVEFDSGARAHFTISECQSLILAYAITGHKSQGSQYPFVIMPMSMSHQHMLDKNLVYTEWTRAKDRLFLVGDRNALSFAVSNDIASARRTALPAFLTDVLETLPPCDRQIPPLVSTQSDAPLNAVVTPPAPETAVSAKPQPDTPTIGSVRRFVRGGRTADNNAAVSQAAAVPQATPDKPTHARKFGRGATSQPQTHVSAPIQMAKQEPVTKAEVNPPQVAAADTPLPALVRKFTRGASMVKAPSVSAPTGPEQSLSPQPEFERPDVPEPQKAEASSAPEPAQSDQGSARRFGRRAIAQINVPTNAAEEDLEREETPVASESVGTNPNLNQNRFRRGASMR